MKAILISIQPKWCELIANGKKTVEVRKTKPKLETPFKCFIYCTLACKVLQGLDDNRNPIYSKVKKGKVIGEFVCKKFTYIEAGYDTNGKKHLYNTAFIEHRMCIPDNELHGYLYKSRENCGGWAWHISDLVIYDYPIEISDKAPRSWKYVEVVTENE
jgi:predicted transcriptional regulator